MPSFIKKVGNVFKGVIVGLMKLIGSTWMHFFFAIQTTLLLAILVTWSVAKFSRKETKAFDRSTLPPTPVEVQEVHLTSFEQESVLTGSLSAPEHVALKTELPGRLKEIVVKPNIDVQKGDTLFVFEDSMAKAELQESEARLRLAQAKYKRDLALRQKAAKSLKDVEETAAQVAVAQANFAKSKAALDRTVIKAPFDGRVGLYTMSPGAFIRSEEELVTLASTDPLHLTFCVPEKYLDSIHQGDEVRFSVDSAKGYEFSAQLTEIDAQSHPTQHCVRCRAQLANNVATLRHGLYARVRVKTRVNENVIVAPQSAIETRGTNSFVYVVEDGKVHHRNVRIGGRSGGNVEILSGLSEGDKVVTAGQLRIQDGFPVFVIPPKLLG
ncbi:MAG: efflux RND transporter periplasmic adaptor subunit [Alphaproteobacteria bacterium]|nr:efflux RND transporter periplasmic adaptor subunit [Alphaproteobacteria bacterium]